MLFAALKPGLQTDGCGVLADLGWSSFHITAKFGIECFIGVSGFISEDDFLAKIRISVGSGLSDWEACHVDLFECWYPPLQSSRPDDAFCYAGWRMAPDHDAIKSTKITVFALRHKSWMALREGRVKSFQCARQRSYAEEAWAITHPGEPISPQAMQGFTDIGVYLTGVVEGSQSAIRLTWPCANLASVITAAKDFAEQGVQQIYMWEGGLGFSIDEISPSEMANLLGQFSRYGEEMPLADLAQQARII